MRPRRLMPGTLFAETYLIEALIGQGAMGLVYRARHAESRALSAIKLMNADLVDEPGFSERFVQEAAIGSSIPNDGIVQVLATGVDPGTGLPWMAMEYLQGKDLGKYLEQENDTLPPEPRHRLLVQLFEAIDAAHRRRIVHRDLKPENLFVVEQAGLPPKLKVLDFGVAKVVRDATLGGTRPGLGAPLWAAPEQGKAGQRIVASSDVWSLGLLTFWLLTGKRYWLQANEPSASQFDLAVEILRADIVPASARALELGVAEVLPAGFDAWFARCVHRQPAARYPNAGQALAPLKQLLAGEPILDRPPRNRLLFAGLLAVLVAGVLAALALGWRH